MEILNANSSNFNITETKLVRGSCVWSCSDPVCEGFPLASYCLLTDGDAFVLGLMDLSGVCIILELA